MPWMILWLFSHDFSQLLRIAHLFFLQIELKLVLLINNRIPIYIGSSFHLDEITTPYFSCCLECGFQYPLMTSHGRWLDCSHVYFSFFYSYHCGPYIECFDMQWWSTSYSTTCFRDPSHYDSVFFRTVVFASRWRLLLTFFVRSSVVSTCVALRNSMVVGIPYLSMFLTWLFTTMAGDEP